VSTNEDTEERWTGFEVGSGDYIVCSPDDARARIRLDTAVTLEEAAERE
jgi:hypothetical protein